MNNPSFHSSYDFNSQAKLHLIVNMIQGTYRMTLRINDLPCCTLDDRSLAVLIMCLHPKKISQTHKQRVAGACSCRKVISI